MSDDWDIDDDELNAKVEVKADNSKFNDEFEGDFDDLKETKVIEQKVVPKVEEKPQTTQTKPWGNKPVAQQAPQPYAQKAEEPPKPATNQPAKPWANKVAQPAPQPFAQKAEEKPASNQPPKPWAKGPPTSVSQPAAAQPAAQPKPSDKPKETTPAAKPTPTPTPAAAKPAAKPQAPQPYAQQAKQPQAQPKQPPPKKPQPPSASKAAVDQKVQALSPKPQNTGPAKPGPKFEFQPKSAKDFADFQKKVVDSVFPYSAEDDYVTFCVEVSKSLASAEDVSADDVRQMVTALTLIMNQKIKTAKTSSKKPVKKKGGVTLSRGAANAFDDLTDAKYDNDLEDDFM